MRPSLTRLWSVVAAACALGCGGGQSGTESGGGKIIMPPDVITSVAPGCGCFLADSGRAVRATLTSADPCAMRARVVEALGSADDASGPALQAGDEIGGTLRQDCAHGLALASGDEVLIIHRPGGEATYNCPERMRCIEACEPPAILDGGTTDPDEQADYDACTVRCEPDTAEPCAAHEGYAQLHGELLVVPWAQTLQVSSEPGAERSLPREELDLLLDFARCLETLYPPMDGGMPGSSLAGFDTLSGDDAGVEDAPFCGAL